MATAAIHSDDPRYLMEKLRGQELHFDGQSVGLIVVPYIDEHCIMVKASIRANVDVIGKYIRCNGDLFRVKTIEPGALTIVDVHCDKRLTPIKAID